MPRRKPPPVEGVVPDQPPRPVRRRRSKKVSRQMTDGLVQLVNLPLTLFAADWALEAHEVAALSLSLCELAAAEPWVAQVLINLASARGWGSFPAVLGAIVAKRLAQAGRIPEAVAMPADVLLRAMAGAGLPLPAQAGDWQAGGSVAAVPETEVS